MAEADSSWHGQDRLKVAWLSYFPVEWLDNVPEDVATLPRQHPATWQQSLLAELETRPDLELHIMVVRNRFSRDLVFTRNGVTFHLLKTPRYSRAPSLFWVDTLKIRKALRTIQPQVLHAWGTENGAALIALRLGYPHLVSVQGLFEWFHQLIPLHPYEKLLRRLERHSLKRVSLISAESAATVAQIESGFDRSGVLHIEHPPMGYFFRIERTPSLKPIRFLTVGTMGYRKGSDLYLSALGRLIHEFDFECVAIGRPNEDFLSPLRAKLPADLWRRFQFKYGLDDAQMGEEYRRATLTVMPTRADTGPVAVKEAVVAGIPVIASRMGGVPEYVEPDKNGLICRPADLEDLVDKIRAACRHPLFGQGKVDPTTLQQKRAELSPARAARLFAEAYARARREQSKPVAS